MVKGRRGRKERIKRREKKSIKERIYPQRRQEATAAAAVAVAVSCRVSYCLMSRCCPRRRCRFWSTVGDTDGPLDSIERPILASPESRLIRNLLTRTTHHKWQPSSSLSSLIPSAASPTPTPRNPLLGQQRKSTIANQIGELAQASAAVLGSFYSKVI